jgi:hypothetical protein
MLSSRFWANSVMLAIFFLLGLINSPALHADTLDSSIISMFPRDVRELNMLI